MDPELLTFINADLKWNSLKKGRRSTTRCPKKPRAEGLESGNKIVDASLKKRKLLQQSPLPPPQTPCLHGDRGQPAGPLTPSSHYNDPSQQYHSSSISQNQKKKSKTRLRNKNLSKKVDFSGIELLAATACSSLVHDTEDHVNEEHTVHEVNSCSIDVKEEAIISTESGGSSNQDIQILNQKAGPSKELRLHWDLNTVMDEWEEPCDEHTGGGVSMNAEVPLNESCNGDSLRKSCEDLVTKTNTSKTSDCESCVSKSDVVDSLIQGVKCEDVSTSTTSSALQEETMVKCESVSKSDQQPVSEEIILCKSYCDKSKVSSEDPPSDCCGSNVTQDEQGHMDKVNSGYDSPFEDGELRENNDSNDTYKDDFGTIENPSSEKVKSTRDHGQTLEDESSLLVKDSLPNTAVVQEDTFERPHSQKDIEDSDCGSGKESSRRKNGHDESTSFSYAPQSRCSYNVRGYERERMKTINRNYTPSGGYQSRRPSSSETERNNGDIHRASNRYRFHSQEYNHERKVGCYSPKRSRSRSGSPIAWHFQKRRNSDPTPSLDHVSPQRFSKGFDDRKFTDAQFRDKRHSRFDSIGYNNERSKADDHFRFGQQSGRFSNHKYKENGYTYTRK